MGRLITLNEISGVEDHGINASWYFDDAFRVYSTSKYKINWPNISYPSCIAIHETKLYNNSVKIEIRKWIENTLSDTVILYPINKSYRRYYGEPGDFEESSMISNIWQGFYFDNEHSATLFKLRFSDIVSEVTDYHPCSDK